MLNPQPPKTNEKLDQAGFELISIQGEKSRIQSEIDDIVLNKIRIEKEISELSNKFDKEYSEKKDFLTIEIGKLEEEIFQLKSLSEKLRKEHKINNDFTLRLNTEKNSIENSIVSLQKEKSAIAYTVDELKIQEKNIIKNVETLNFSKKNLESYQNDLVASLKNLEIKEGILKENISNLENTFHSHTEKIKGISESHDELVKNKSQLVSFISEKRVQLNDILTQLEENTNKNNQYIIDMKKREDDISKRAGNLAILEGRVDEKLRQLEDFKKEFTIEHLARGGIK